MITFKSVQFSNFLSSGNNPIRIELNKNKSTLIVGHNGAGKSTILDALSFGLFGKPHRSVSKNQLINSVNLKNTVVEVEFNTHGTDFKIVRGIKPNIFEIWQDGVMIDQSASVRDYQKYLEQNILKLTHKSFHQIVVLGSSSFIPFMQLPSNHRREVIEDLLDINIFSKMKIILKERVQENKAKFKANTAELEVLKGKIQYLSSHIDSVKEINKKVHNENNKLNDQIDRDIDKLKVRGMNILNELPEVSQDALSELNKISIDLNTKQAETNKSISDLTKEHSFYMNNDSCPTCSQDLSQQLKADRINSIKESAKSLKEQNDKLTSEKNDNDVKIEDIKSLLDTHRKLTNEMKNIQTQINMLETSKVQKKEEVDLSNEISELKTLKTKADECASEVQELATKGLYFDVAQELLKDSGIRTKIIKEYLPVMSTLINKYLQTLDFFVHFNLDESFNETIKSRHRDTFVYSNFSEGEKQRIDLSLLFAWRQVAKMKNSTNTNLLILDETFDSSLDTDGVDNLMKILYTLDKDTNTFVISHKPDLLESKLEHKIEFKRPNNFSMIA